MPNTTTALTAAGETYFADLGRVRASGGATGERFSRLTISPFCHGLLAPIRRPIMLPCEACSTAG